MKKRRKVAIMKTSSTQSNVFHDRKFISGIRARFRYQLSYSREDVKANILGSSFKGKKNQKN